METSIKRRRIVFANNNRYASDEYKCLNCDISHRFLSFKEFTTHEIQCSGTKTKLTVKQEPDPVDSAYGSEHSDDVAADVKSTLAPCLPSPTKPVSNHTDLSTPSTLKRKRDPSPPSPMVQFHAPIKVEPSAPSPAKIFPRSETAVPCINRDHGCPKAARPQGLILHQHICGYNKPVSTYIAETQTRKLTTTGFLGVDLSMDGNFVPFCNSFLKSHQVQFSFLQIKSEKLVFLGHTSSTAIKDSNYRLRLYAAGEKFTLRGTFNNQLCFSLPLALVSEKVIKYKISLFINEPPIVLD